MSVRVDPVTWRWVAKRGGGGRRMAELSDRDAAGWRETVRAMTPDVDRRLDERVLANRVDAGERWRTEPVGRSLTRARRAARTIATKAGVVLHTDVAAFYPSVDAPVLARSLRGAGADPRTARRAADLIEGWSSFGYPGLPIGPPASAILANAVLASVDAALEGILWLRWVDDYLVGLPSEGTAAMVLDRFDERLDALGLHRSERKTRLVEGGPCVWPGGRNSGTM
jgi:hypothetical protein